MHEGSATPDRDLVADIKSVAEKLKKRTLSRSEYLQHGKFSGYHLYEGGRTWECLCKSAGVRCRKVEPISDEEYFSRLKSAMKELGRRPKSSERKRFGLNFSKRRYPTLKAFIEKAAELGVIPRDLDVDSVKEHQPPPPANDQRLSAVGADSGERRRVPPIPTGNKRSKWSRIDLDGHPYAPQDELGVVAVFAILCHKKTINWQILDLSSSGIDATCYDHVMEREIRVELKLMLSRASWNHSIDDLDYVVCWENRWPDFPKPVIELRTLLEDKPNPPPRLSI